VVVDIDDKKLQLTMTRQKDNIENEEKEHHHHHQLPTSSQ